MPGTIRAPGEVQISTDDSGNPIWGTPGGGGTKVDDWGNTVHSDGSPIFVDLNNANDIANLRQNYTQLQGMTDAQIRAYVGNDNFQLGGNRTGANPLTHIVNNAGVTGLSGLIGDVKGFLTDTGGAGGLIAGAGLGGLLSGGSAVANGFDPLTMGDASLGNFTGGNIAASDGLDGFTGGSEGGSLPNGGGGAPNYAPDAPGGSNPYNLPDTPYGNGDPLVNNPSTFNPSAPDIPYGNGDPLVNNPQAFNPSTIPNVPPGAQSALQRLLSGNATTADYTQLAGTLGSTLLGYLGSEAKANALSGTADKYLALGAPYRGMLAQSYSPDFKATNIPGYQDAIDNSMNSYLRKASTGGNPFTNPGVSTEALKYVTAGTALPELNTYRSQLASQGGLGLNTAGTADLGAAGQAGGTYDALGYGLGQLTQPQNSLADLLKQYGISTPKLNLSGVA